MDRERSKNFIDQAKAKTDRSFQETSATIKDLSEVFSQYSTVVSDLLEAKSSYVSIVEKYLDTNSSTGLSDYFPGITQKKAEVVMPKEEMEIDSNKMNEMAELVKDLEIQKESLEDQLERTFKKAVNNIHQIESLSAQANSYLDNMISEVGEIYGSSTMQQLVQRNSV